jgi:arylsulfatase A-like enzyme
MAALLVLAVTTPTCAASENTALAARPNLVFILLDNLGQEWLGCYGSEEGCTPNIDRLAREGVRIENCYTPPVCGPSRIVALTGRYLLRSGMLLHHDAALYSGGGLDPARETTFARVLRDAGYRTAIAGKWQINNLYDEPDVLQRHGFDESLVWPGSIDPAKATPEEMRQYWKAVAAADPEFTQPFISRIESRYWDPVMLRNGKREVHPGRFGPDVFQEFALDFIRRRDERPFLLYCPVVLAHGQTFTQPVVPTPLNPDSDRPHHAMYADMVRYADRLIGALVEELDRAGVRDRTMVFVATDNGTEKSLSARCGGRTVQGGLYQLTEAGGNVALLVNCPSRIPGGRMLPLADFSDLVPTFCELANVPPPRDRPIDGQSFARFLLDAAAAPPRSWIFNQYGTVRVVRDHRFKLYSDGRFYDLREDREEQHDLRAALNPELVNAQQRLQTALRSLPSDAPPPFELRSQSAFRLKQAAR